MRRPRGPQIHLDEIGSTQDVAAEKLRAGEPAGVISTSHQTGGRGRFNRIWTSDRGDSLTASLVFSHYSDHPRPHLIGMSLAIAAAGALHCQIQWPNDLVLGGKKLGGILTEIITDAHGKRVPVVGMGINLNQESFPPELSGATSLKIARGVGEDPQVCLEKILERLDLLPEPEDWSDLAPSWMLFDTTPGKLYKLPDGGEAVAIGIGPEGQLLCAVDGESTSVLAADAIFGVGAN